MSDVNDGKSDKYMTNDRGYNLYCQYWSRSNAETKPRALLFITHGLAEHCLYYDELATILSKEGFYVFAHDHQGHGQSEGSRCLIGDLRDYSNDVLKHIDKVKEQYPDLPVFIFGHSMGGAITILAALDRPDFFTGVVLLGAVITPEQDSVGPVRIFLGKIIARLIPQCPVLWLDPKDISRDQLMCEKYDDDPLVYHGGIKARTGLALLTACQEMESKLESIKWPFLVIHGGHDRIVSPEGSKKLFEKAASKDKTLKLYDESFHQVHHEVEPDKSQMLEEVRQWLCQRLT